MSKSMAVFSARSQVIFRKYGQIHGIFKWNVQLTSAKDLASCRKNFSSFGVQNKAILRTCTADQCTPSSLWSKKQLLSPLACHTTDRHCSTDTGRKSLPPLMDFPEILWPSMFKSLRNWVLTTFVINPYFDREFSVPDFIKGAKQALVKVSNSLATGDFASLEGLVEASTLSQVKNAVSRLSLQQRQSLGVELDDIYFSFPYQIGIMFDDAEQAEQQRFVEITVCYHVFKGLGELRKQGSQPGPMVFHGPEDQSHRKDNIMVCNYRYICEYTKGVQGQWMVNVINHFKPADRME